MDFLVVAKLCYSYACQGCQHCDIEKQETPNFIVLCARVRACYEKREAYLVSTGKKRFTQKSGDSREIGRVGNPGLLMLPTHAFVQLT